MAKKKCPKCQQTLPVACKSCPCGHIFLAKKHSTLKDSDGKQKNYVSVSVTRLRPERPKREIPDYEYRYRDSYTRMSMGNGDAQLKAISKKMKLIGKGDYDYGDEDVFLGGKSGYGGSESQTGAIKRKRGRPKGSKNKPKYDPNFMADLSDDDSGDLKDSKANNAKKVYELPPIPEDKVMVYSLILSDINERFVSQNKIKCLPGL